MPTGKSAVALFALVVAAAIGAVAWLVLSGGPPPSRSTTDGPHPAPPVHPAPSPPEEGLKPPKPDPRRPRNPTPIVLEVKGRVLGPAGAPEAGAEVVVFRPVREGPAGASATPAPPEEKVDPEVLRECFALTHEEMSSSSWYSGVPRPPESKEPAPEAGTRKAPEVAPGRLHELLRAVRARLAAVRPRPAPSRYRA